jgi:hypothetical protein
MRRVCARAGRARFEALLSTGATEWLAGLADAVTGITERSGAKLLARLKEHCEQFAESVARTLDEHTLLFFAAQVKLMAAAIAKLEQNAEPG